MRKTPGIRPFQQVRLVSAKAERPNHPSLGGGGGPPRQRRRRRDSIRPIWLTVALGIKSYLNNNSRSLFIFYSHRLSTCFQSVDWFLCSYTIPKIFFTENSVSQKKLQLSSTTKHATFRPMCNYKNMLPLKMRIYTTRMHDTSPQGLNKTVLKQPIFCWTVQWLEHNHPLFNNCIHISELKSNSSWSYPHGTNGKQWRWGEELCTDDGCRTHWNHLTHDLFALYYRIICNWKETNETKFSMKTDSASLLLEAVVAVVWILFAHQRTRSFLLFGP